MDADAVIDWLLTEAVDIEELEELVEATARRMIAAGFPLTHLFQSTMVGHPLVQARNTNWSEDGVETTLLPHGFVLQPGMRDNPPFEVARAGRRFWMARAADGPTRYELLQRRFAEGATHYLIYRTGTGDPSPEVLSKPGKLPPFNIYGFTFASDVDIDEKSVRRIMHALDPLARLHMERFSGESLLNAYLGEDAAQRVLGGLVRRGEKMGIEAAIAFTDLRGFSSVSESMEPEDVLDLLNDAFDVQVEAIERHGGHVLKFMGDGLLAIWPEGECDAALAAAVDMEHAIGSVNEQRAREGKRPIDFGVGLHVGRVVYGNIGSAGRLDFTVIGRAVNRTARLESMCSRLGEKTLMTEAFAVRVSTEVRDLGTHEAKGVGEIRVFGLVR